MSLTIRNYMEERVGNGFYIIHVSYKAVGNGFGKLFNESVTVVRVKINKFYITKLFYSKNQVQVKSQERFLRLSSRNGNYINI